MQAVVRASIDAARISEDAQALDVLATKLGRDLHCRVLFEGWESGHIPCLHREGRKSGLVS